MNYVDDRTVPLCIACGAEIPAQPEDPTAQACDGCFAESEAKAASARQAEAADEFQWMSREWLRKGVYLCDDCGICPDQLIERCCGDRVCVNCEEARNYSDAERSEEAANEAYYGGDCDAEVYERAAQRSFDRSIKR